jgi:SprT-like family
VTEQAALNFANEQLRLHGLAEKGWRVEIQPGRLVRDSRCAGVTGFRADGGGIIVLRLRDVLAASDEEVRDTILHEVAHALAGPANTGHGPKWREMARRVGAKDNAHGLDPFSLELRRLLRKTGLRLR